MPKLFPYRLYLVTDEAACLGRDFFWVVEEAIKGGVDIVQLREKHLDNDAFFEKAMKLKRICRQYSIPLIINDNIDVAVAVDADGVHVGQSDLSISAVINRVGVQMPIGLSLERFEDLKAEGAEDAWYYGVSPIFSTPTKVDTVSEWGLEGLSSLRKLTDKKLVAIGNIKIENAAQIISSGADCLAVVSGICSATDPASAAAAFKSEIAKGLKNLI
ncbi:thiamine phosphate synthase [Belliella sp. DSM 111904]|uniref:Thiamine-phosphate synthase n=1 Tax=Belliella filtrata TaxID=2923435 RepID=A0ABS9UYS3_9BACT|nr:thiamine phosphate synthase [Belliella filtrata]MCH7409308.1 thiamine phosphate synthase [Belliella filtrata]